MNSKYYELIDENLYSFTCENGLQVFLLPKNDFTKTYGIIGINFGSTNNRYQVAHQSYQVIDGAAHFLEHKMFEKNDYDVMDLFNKQQASCNAYTSFDKTAYLFSASNNVISNVNTLLDFVQNLELSDESVAKEKPIIAQEISMYDDDVNWQSFFKAINTLYHHNSVKIDIAGTKESIEAITKEDLYHYYDYFYHPSNSILFVCGNFNINEMEEAIKTNQGLKSFKNLKFEYQYEEEPKEVVTKEITHYMDISNNRLVLSFKVNEFILEPLLQDLGLGIMMDMLFSKKTSFYQDLLDQEIIHDNYSYQYYQNEQQKYAFAQFFFVSDQIPLLKEALHNYFKQDFANDLQEEDFNIIKARYLGDFIRIFNSPDSIANSFISYHLSGYDLFEVIDQINKISLNDLKQLTTLFDLNYSSICIIAPKNESEES
ncbi:MAG: EF-P 5-aminopentanol modification-associated protein YfmH [Bacilli bacterium]